MRKIGQVGKIRRGAAVIWLKHQRNILNSNPTVITSHAGRKGRTIRRLVVADKYIEKRMRELLDLMKDEEKYARKNAKEMFDGGARIGYHEVEVLTRRYFEYKSELIELSDRLKEIKKARNDARQKARSRARKIAGKKLPYIETTSSEANPNRTRLTE
jgi:hypothetical protein